MAKRSKSSTRWLQEHVSDPFVKAAREAGFRSRAAFKLEEIQRKDRILRPGMTVVDLGAAPGSWSQYAVRCLQGQGRVVALDILPMAAISGVEFIQGDFSQETALTALQTQLAGDRPDLVMSDIAPNTMGIADVDHLRSMYLVELVLDFTEQSLKDGGDFLVKVFQGRDLPELMARLRRRFTAVKVRKPSASRARSVEVYLLARGFKMV